CAPASRASCSRARIFCSLPAMSPTVWFSWARAMRIAHQVSRTRPSAPHRRRDADACGPGRAARGDARGGREGTDRGLEVGTKRVEVGHRVIVPEQAEPEAPVV